jgi:protein-S-isoprenylcysteine O-methyltransferase Ste14
VSGGSGRLASRPADMNAPLTKSILRRIVVGTGGLILFASFWFGVAGRLTWWQGWAYLLGFAAYSIVLAWRLWRVVPELLRERNQPAERAEPWDRAVMGLYGVFLLLFLVVAALDGGRYRWSSVPLGIQLVGWCLLVVAGLTVWHVMMTNFYLSSWARLQQDRGQVVIQEGAYRRIRHPMYLGVIVAFLGMPLALASWGAAIPGMVIVGLFVYRTYREDLMLVHGLAGYADYAERVRYRLLPGVW